MVLTHSHVQIRNKLAQRERVLSMDCARYQTNTRFCVCVRACVSLGGPEYSLQNVLGVSFGLTLPDNRLTVQL